VKNWRGSWLSGLSVVYSISAVGCGPPAQVTSADPPPAAEGPEGEGQGDLTVSLLRLPDPPAGALDQDSPPDDWLKRFPEMGSQERALRTVDDQLSELLSALTSDYLAVRLESIESLGRLPMEPGSERAADVVQILIAQRRQGFNDYEDRAIDVTLRQMGPVAIAEVQRLAKSDQLRELSDACEAMRALGQPAYPELRELLNGMLTSQSPARHWGAMYCLEAMGPPAADALPLVAGFLNDPDFQNQIIALRALVGIGPASVAHWETVKELTATGQNISVVSHALRTLGYISAEDPEKARAAAEVIGGHLNAFAFMTKSRALEGLIALGEMAAPAQPQVEELLQDRTGLAPQAAVVFGNITGQWDRPIELLSTLTQDFVVGTESVLLLKGLGVRARPALAALAPLVNDEDPTVALPAVEALVAQIQLESADDFARLTPDDLTHLEKVGQILQGLAAGGQGDPHHYAQVVLKKWQSFGWRPPTAADRDQ
jgi:hypothetical protein